jgi:hypothetical protein
LSISEEGEDALLDDFLEDEIFVIVTKFKDISLKQVI